MSSEGPKVRGQPARGRTGPLGWQGGRESKPLPIGSGKHRQPREQTAWSWWREGEALRTCFAPPGGARPLFTTHPSNSSRPKADGKVSMGKQQKRGGAKKFSEGPPSDSEEEEEEVKGKARGVSAQSNTAGMLPPNSSDEEEEEEPPKKGKGVTKQSETAGMMPPGSSDEESDDEPEVRWLG